MMERIIMADRNIGPGEQANKARSRRILTTMAALVFGGFVVGFTGAMVEQKVPGDVGTFPPGFAIAATVFFLALIIGGSWRYFRSIDELEKKNNYVGAIWGANIYLTVYPAWYMLWKGGLVREPMHEALFVVMIFSTFVAYLWHKYRL